MRPRFTISVLKDIHETLQRFYDDIEDGVRDEVILYRCTRVSAHTIPRVLALERPFRAGNTRMAYVVHCALKGKADNYSKIITQEQRFLTLLRDLKKNSFLKVCRVIFLSI